MSFRYDVVQPHVIDRLKELFSKPTTTWTEDERRDAAFLIQALQIAADQWRQK